MSLLQKSCFADHRLAYCFVSSEFRIYMHGLTCPLFILSKRLSTMRVLIPKRAIHDANMSLLLNVSHNAKD